MYSTVLKPTYTNKFYNNEVCNIINNLETAVQNMSGICGLPCIINRQLNLIIKFQQV